MNDLSKKQTVRRSVSERLKSMTQTEKARADEIIRNALFSLPAFQAARTVFCYLSMPREVDTSLIIPECLRQGKRVLIPYTSGGVMYTVEYTSELTVGDYGIATPISPVIVDEAVDLSIIPSVAFDDCKGRLGHGKGYYDKYLSYNGGVKVALAYALQRTDSVYGEPHDVLMDTVITEGGVL